MFSIRYLLIPCIVFCWISFADAASPIVSDENIHINSDRMNQNSGDGFYTAEGNVLVIWKGLSLSADKIRYSAATHEIYATGSVVLTKDSAIAKGKVLTLNTDTGRAEMDTAQLTVSESKMTIVSEKLVRLDENRFNLTSTELTTCDVTDPSWKFKVDDLNVNTQDYATGRRVIFYIKNIPVLYLPWISFPVALEKKSGLLFPQFGYSRRRGVQLDIPLYWVISPSQDVELDLDLMSRRGVGTGVDYRYIRKRGSEGHLDFYPIYDQLENKFRWQLSQEHKEIISNDANLRMSVNLTSDRAFLNDFGEKSGDYNRQSTDTVINTLKTWQNFGVSSHLRYSEELYAANNQSTLQLLPSIGLFGVRQGIYSMPLYFDIDATADNLYRESVPSGQRLYLFPRISILPFRNSFLQSELFAGAHIRGYLTDRRGNNSRIENIEGDLLPETGARLSTSLTKIYDTNFKSLKKIRHEVIPELRYNFVPERDQKHIPFYDYSDRLIHRNTATLSATSFINGKFFGDTAEYRDISRIKLSADYLISGERRDLLTLVDSQRSWSDLILESETWVNKQLRVTFDSRFDLYENHLSTAVAGIQFDDRSGNSIGSGYQMARNEVEYFEGRLSTKFIKPLNLSYLARYSFDRGDFLETVYSAEYRHKCWSVNLAVHQRPGNNSYTVNFNLAGLGSK